MLAEAYKDKLPSLMDKHDDVISTDNYDDRIKMTLKYMTNHL